MEKKLARPNITSGNPPSAKSSASIEQPSAEQMTLRRDLAKRNAMDKVRSRTVAKQQQLAERVATATEQMAASIEQASNAATELAGTMEQVATGAEEAASGC